MDHPEAKSHEIESFDGTRIAVHEVGQGRPLILLHGLFSNAQTNWIKFGHAAHLVSRGFQVIMPDLRGHGDSAAPQGGDSYPANVAIADARAVIATLDGEPYDLGGFSLGAKICAQMLADGVRPRRAILAGIGLAGLVDWERRSQFFVTAIDRREEVERGDPHWMAVQFLRTTGTDPIAARHLLLSLSDLDVVRLRDVDLPVLVLSGREDRDNGDPQELADLLPQGRMKWIDGTHMSCVVKPELGEAIGDFLAD